MPPKGAAIGGTWHNPVAKADGRGGGFLWWTCRDSHLTEAVGPVALPRGNSTSARSSSASRNDEKAENEASVMENGINDEVIAAAPLHAGAQAG
jgi:hypothetical protein